MPGDTGRGDLLLQYARKPTVRYLSRRLSTSMGLSYGGVYDGDPAVDDEGGSGDK